jgi:hypothetical protein
MHTRVINLLLAFVLLWSGFSTEGFPLTRALTSAENVDARSSGDIGVRGGSQDDRCVADVPAQELVETTADVHAVLMEGAPAPGASLTMAPPGPYAARSRSSPYLDGPLRPPSAKTLVA